MVNPDGSESTQPGFGYFMYHLAWQAADWLYPPICASCGKPGSRWCDECFDKTSVITSPICPTCGAPISKGEPCRECKDHPPSFDYLRSWAIFGGPVRLALHHLKYGRDLGIAEVLARPLAEIVKREKWEIDFIIPIPLSKSHFRQRGYNQAEAIAVPISLELKKKCLTKIVTRSKETSSQIDLSAAQRYANLQDAFSVNPAKLKGRNILLIDDVATTGATLNSCSRALRDVGVETIYCLTVAKALRKNNEASVGS